MSLLKIARLGHPVIREGAATVTAQELSSNEAQRLIDDMVETMRDADGVGIAAPQVHVAKKIIVVEVSVDNPRYPAQEAVPLTVIINPRIIHRISDKALGWEGCLSVPDMRGRVPRATMIEVQGLNRYGIEIQFEARGFFARVIQHEVDHLHGHVFIDRVNDLSTLTHLREYRKFWKNS